MIQPVPLTPHAQLERQVVCLSEDLNVVLEQLISAHNLSTSARTALQHASNMAVSHTTELAELLDVATAIGLVRNTQRVLY